MTSNHWNDTKIIITDPKNLEKVVSFMNLPIWVIYVKITKIIFFGNMANFFTLNHWNNTRIIFLDPKNLEKVVSFMILAILVFSIKTLKTHFCHKAKNKDSWVFKIYMGIHTPSIDSHTNIYVNQPKTKRVMAKKLDFLLLFLHRTTCN